MKLSMTSYSKMLISYSYLPIVYGPRFIPSDAANSAADIPQAPAG